METPVTGIRHEGGRATGGRGRGRRRHHRVPRRPRHLVDAVLAAAQGHGPAGARRGAGRGRRPALPRLPLRGARGPGRQGAVDRQLDLHPRPRGQDHAGPELRLVVAVHGHATAATSSASSTRWPRATSGGPPPTTSSSSRARPSSRRSGLVDAADVEAGYVVRMPKAYPVYDEAYQAQRRRSCGEWLEANTPNVHPVGRNGMHRYNNQDHSMYTAMLTVENILDRRRPRHLGGQRRGGVPRGGRADRRRRRPARQGPAAPAATPRSSPSAS